MAINKHLTKTNAKLLKWIRFGTKEKRKINKLHFAEWCFMKNIFVIFKNFSIAPNPDFSNYFQTETSVKGEQHWAADKTPVGPSQPGSITVPGV